MSSAVTSISPPEHHSQLDHPIHTPSRVVVDAIINYSATVFSACVGLVMVPILLHGLGTTAYGLLLTSLMVGSMLPFDLGLGWSLTHEIAKAKSDGSQPASPFVGLAGWLFLALGLVGSTVVIAFGIFFARLHPGDGHSVQTTQLIFLLAGVGFLGEHMQVYIISVLHGLRRFAFANLFLMVSVFFRAVGSYVILRSGLALVSISVWLASVSLFAGLCGVIFVSRLDHAVRWRQQLPRWSDVNEHLGLAFSGQATMTATNWFWQSTPLLAGLIRGAASVVPFYIGQRFPLGVSLLNWKAAEPIFPAASATLDRVDDRKAVFLAGTRWITAISLPLCLFLWMQAPVLLQAWIGDHSESAVLILRLTTVAVFADSLSVGAIHLLLAAHSTRPVLVTILSATLTTVLSSLVLLYLFSPSYAVWCLVIPMIAATVALLWLSHQSCGVGMRDFLRLAKGLFIPALVFSLVLWSIMRGFAGRSLADLFTMGLISSACYTAVLFYTALSSQERSATMRTLISPITATLKSSSVN